MLYASPGIGRFLVPGFVKPLSAGNHERSLSQTWDHELLTIRGDHLSVARGLTPGGFLPRWFCHERLERDRRSPPHARGGHS